jgi:hypothetical protein
MTRIHRFHFLRAMQDHAFCRYIADVYDVIPAQAEAPFNSEAGQCRRDSFSEPDSAWLPTSKTQSVGRPTNLSPFFKEHFLPTTSNISN